MQVNLLKIMNVLITDIHFRYTIELLIEQIKDIYRIYLNKNIIFSKHNQNCVRLLMLNSLCVMLVMR